MIIEEAQTPEKLDVESLSYLYASLLSVLGVARTSHIVAQRSLRVALLIRMQKIAKQHQAGHSISKRLARCPLDKSAQRVSRTATHCHIAKLSSFRFGYLAPYCFASLASCALSFPKGRGSGRSQD